MKKIIIIGKNSYIGISLKNWLNKYPEKYNVAAAAARTGEWREISFSEYDVVIDTAGIVHESSDKSIKELYYSINRDLTVEICKKAMKEGAKQFIFLSSIKVFGDKNKIIDRNTVPRPENPYGDSKLKADNIIYGMNSEKFCAAIVRPPMVYGKESKGNYKKLVSLSKKLPVFPDFDNKRSMIYIDNLCECIRLIIESGQGGYFYPQNREYVKTAEMVKLINPKIKLIGHFNFLIKLLMNLKIIDKVFGDLVYDKNLSDCFDYKYCVEDFEKSIIQSR